MIQKGFTGFYVSFRVSDQCCRLRVYRVLGVEVRDFGLRTGLVT